MSLLDEALDASFLAEVDALEAQHASTAASTTAAPNLPQQPLVADAPAAVAAAIPRSPLQPLATAAPAAAASSAPRPKRMLPSSIAAGGASRPKRTLPSSIGAPAPSTLPELATPPVVYSRSEPEADELCAALAAAHARGECTELGFDIEWQVTFVTNAAPRKAATVQLAAARSVLVLQLSEMRGFPAALAALLEDATLPKLGVGISNDGLKLRRDYGVRCAGLVDLSPLAGRALADGARPWNLADLCERVLGRRLPKELRLSDWEANPLSPEQLAYAAADAVAAQRIYKELERRWERRPTGRAALAGAATFAGACAELSVDVPAAPGAT